MGESLRLDKYLADMGVGTRSEVKGYIRKGRVKVNSQVEKQPERKITGEDTVTFDERRISYIETEYYMLNKPAGVVSATRDKLSSTVVDLIDEGKRKDLFPVGRLDKDTEGLLLITNDGDLAHRLLSPKKHVKKLYFARVQGRVEMEDVLRFQEGITLEEDFTTLPAELLIKKTGEESEVFVTVCEGKFHQIKRMFEAVGKEVLYLKRLKMGELALDETLCPGEYRKLTREEIELLKN
ncbi:pseudouridine synthase [Anaerocolumna xylanovorans]|uniref:Pseudouridine synthase n=1 Tax=Anaerocolumna xylanovorans DSM 12503 TaxID=1121345 RepID=A0A1M7YAW2_9FIRM|nr:pseudouridine synthase [Anaerocolumna xylanovorans]SHO49784.1 ribosomal small subunit pseudouridine synthase A [Anaerocolumna xylanovorans DSM 12503]